MVERFDFLLYTQVKWLLEFWVLKPDVGSYTHVNQFAEAKIDAAALSSNGVEKFRIHLERHQEIRKLQTPSARVPLLRGSKLLFCYLEARALTRFWFMAASVLSAKWCIALVNVLVTCNFAFWPIMVDTGTATDPPFHQRVCSTAQNIIAWKYILSIK